MFLATEGPCVTPNNIYLDNPQLVAEALDKSPVNDINRAILRWTHVTRVISNPRISSKGGSPAVCEDQNCLHPRISLVNSGMFLLGGIDIAILLGNILFVGSVPHITVTEKTSVILPIHKIGARFDLVSYRPTHRTSIISRNRECLIGGVHTDYHRKHKLISTGKQHS